MDEASGSRLEKWLAGHQRLVLALLVALSFALRGAYFVELNGGPLVELHRWKESDMHFFDAWARRVAAGDWLTDRALHPHLAWHRQVAAAYLEEYPDERAELERRLRPDGRPMDPSRVLWDRWHGGKRFHQEPFYPYVLALNYRLFGGDVRWVLAWQLALGVVSNVLVYLLARRYFGCVPAAVAGLLAVLCGPLLFYEMVLLRSSLITFVGLLLAYAAGSALAHRTWKVWLGMGALLGLAILVKSTFVLFGLGLLALLVHGERRASWRPAATFLVGALASLSPAIGRNLAVGAPAASLSSVGPVTFVCANAPDYRPEVGFYISRHVPGVFRVSGDRLLPAVVETLRRHDGVLSYLRQLWDKFAWTWHAYEKPNNVNFYYYRLHSAILRHLPVTFGLLAPLALVGLVLAARRFHACAPLYLLVATHLAPLLAFYVLSRFRTPLTAALIPFAALTLVRFATLLKRKEFGPGALLLLATGLLAWWCGRPLPPGTEVIRRADYIVPVTHHYLPVVLPRAEEARRAGDWPEVARLLEDVLRHEPPTIATEDTGLVESFAKAHGVYADALDQLGRADAARVERRRALELMQAASGGR